MLRGILSFLTQHLSWKGLFFFVCSFGAGVAVGSVAIPKLDTWFYRNKFNDVQAENAMLNEEISRQEQRISELEKSLQNSVTKAHLEDVVERLESQIKRKEKKIQKLKGRLERSVSKKKYQNLQNELAKKNDKIKRLVSREKYAKIREKLQRARSKTEEAQRRLENIKQSREDWDSFLKKLPITQERAEGHDFHISHLDISSFVDYTVHDSRVAIELNTELFGGYSTYIFDGTIYHFRKNGTRLSLCMEPTHGLGKVKLWVGKRRKKCPLTDLK